MDRRTFLKKKLQALAYISANSCLAASGLFLPTKALASNEAHISIVKGKAAAATRAAIEALGGISRFVKKGQHVVIKPNMSFAQGIESATTTHPEVVREVLVLCKEAGAASVRVLDHGLQSVRLSLEQSGILAACDSVEKGICHHLMDKRFYKTHTIAKAKEMHENAFMKDVLQADVLIAVPVAKSHSSAGVSLSLKGQMGLILNRYAMHSRYDLATSIVDMNLQIKPHLAVIDATRVLTTNGPSGPGKVMKPGEVIASADPVAADATAVARYTWYDQKIQPRQVSHIRLAHERGLGRMDIENMRTVELTL